VAEQIEAAHDAAVTRTLEFLQTEAGYTRVGAHGVAQVDIRGLVAARFTHRDSRAGDPDLHTHVAISNKVQTLDGRWLALDARMLYRMTVAASEFYNTQLEGRSPPGSAARSPNGPPRTGNARSGNSPGSTSG